MASKKAVPVKVIIRAYSGVFVGELLQKSGGPESFDVTLANARHVWNWDSAGLPRKAITLEDLAILGAGSGSRISGAVSTLDIADVKVVAMLSEAAAKRFSEFP